MTHQRLDRQALKSTMLRFFGGAASMGRFRLGVQTHMSCGIDSHGVPSADCHRVLVFGICSNEEKNVECVHRGRAMALGLQTAHSNAATTRISEDFHHEFMPEENKKNHNKQTVLLLKSTRHARELMRPIEFHKSSVAAGGGSV
jgi:hypothetical protein